mmetsp:Transcript_53895/g.98558  ORF Transcript_53895/g.98558 Transcript_53895/m.98558 type:complete len:212 (-) Transcript_53895:42-677(-)
MLEYWFPVQPPGPRPPMPFRKEMTRRFVGVWLLQVIACCIGYFHLDQFLQPLFMVIQITIGAIAYFTGFDITLVSVYGTICVVNGIEQFLLSIIPLCMNDFKVNTYFKINIYDLFLTLFIPIITFMGAWVSWRIYRDWRYAERHPGYGMDTGSGVIDKIGYDIDKDKGLKGYGAVDKFFANTGLQKVPMSGQPRKLGGGPEAGDPFLLGKP